MKIDHEQAVLIRMVRPTYARDYVLAKGWRRITTKSRDYALFETQAAGMLQLLIPQDHQASDYHERVLEVAEKLSEVEGRSLTSVLRDMLRPGSDCIHFRRVSESTKSGVISLLNGVGLLAGIRRLLEAAACGVVDPQLFFKRLQRAEARQFLDTCLLEQTGFGSYEMNVSCPLGAMAPESLSQIILLPDVTDIPFERKVTSYIMSASSQIAESIEADSTNELVDRMGEARQQQGLRPSVIINANFCDALLDIHSADDEAELLISASWAPTLLRAQSTADRVLFRPEYAEKIEDISRQLKPRRDAHEFVNVIASVEALRGDISATGRREGLVDLLVFDKESEELVPASIRLNAELYVIADRAHMQGGYVKVRGTLTRGRRKHSISDVQSFVIEE